jgi:hypothetical protein
MSFRRSTPQNRFVRDGGSTATGFLIAIVVLVALGVAAFFYFGGRADVNIKEPNVDVSTSASPS